jgi:hypothetical protein
LFLPVDDFASASVDLIMYGVKPLAISSVAEGGIAGSSCSQSCRSEPVQINRLFVQHVPRCVGIRREVVQLIH